MKAKLTLIFFFLLILPMLYAAPPTTILESSEAGLQIEFPPHTHLIRGYPHEFHFHVFNITSGMELREGISCYMNLYNTTGHLINSLITTVATADVSYIFNIGADNFTKAGDYGYVTICNTSNLGGFVSVFLEVTETGEQISNDPTPLTAIILLPLIFIFILLYGVTKMDEEHNPLKIGVFLLSPIFFFSSGHFALVTLVNFYNTPELHDLIGSTTYWMGILTALLFTYFLIYILVKAIRTAAQEKEENINY